MPAIKIYDKLTSLRYIFLYQVWLFTRPKFSRKFIQRADVLHTVCFPACLLKICAKCVEGQCRNFFSRSTLHAWIFFVLIFRCMNFFLYFARPPHNFSNGPSLTYYRVNVASIINSRVACVACVERLYIEGNQKYR